MKRVKYEPRGVLAVDPRAFGFLFDVVAEPEVVTCDGVAMITVRGPLEHHDTWWGDSYEAIKGRVAAALEASPTAIVLSIDSPGGLVSGCFETAREIRTMARDAGVPLYAYVDGLAASAAYALACAADVIGVPDTGAVGSIGVIDALVDATAQNAMLGVRVSLVTSGARKADGNPHGAITEDAIAAAQGRVDGLAETFFGWVAESRGLSADDVRRLEAGILVGAAAVSAGLADQVITLDGLLAIASGAQPVEGEGTMSAKASKAYEDAIAALRKAAEGDDDEAAKAKRMLAAELAEDDAPPADDDEEEASAAEEDDQEEPDDEEASAAASAMVPASAAGRLVSAGSKLSSRVSAVEARLERQERAELFAARPDIPKSVAEALAEVPIAAVRKIVAATPKPKVPKLAAAATVVGTRGEGQGTAAPPISSVGTQMDKMMGIAPPEGGVRRDGHAMTFSAAGARAASKGGAK